MKALSFKDPWGWLIAKGIKPVDNRSWKTSFRGRIYIQVSKTFDYAGFNYICVHPELVRCMDTRGKDFCIEDWAALAVMRPNAGKIIGEVDVTNCVEQYDSPWFFGPFGLVHKNPELYPHPVPCKGKIFPHFFDVPPEVEAEIRQMKEAEKC
jgi:hypothetical protein